MNSNSILSERRSPCANQIAPNKGSKHPELKLNLKNIGKESKAFICDKVYRRRNFNDEEGGRPKVVKGRNVIGTKKDVSVRRGILLG